MKRVVVTGVGLLSSLGDDREAHLAALAAERGAAPDEREFAPAPVFRADTDFSRHIAKRGDLRRMERWQRLGVAAAGLAPASAGVGDDASFRNDLEALVAAGGGERDCETDEEILTGITDADDRERLLNRALNDRLRPSLFLAQLSNLLAGNIAVVHGVHGGSRTFKGEEHAGVEALRIGAARIEAGQGDATLIGGSYNAERPDLLLNLALGGVLHEGPFVGAFDPGRSGLTPGSVGAFLLIEAEKSARARGARVMARLGWVGPGWAPLRPGALRASMADLARRSGAEPALVISAAPGVKGRRRGRGWKRARRDRCP